MSSSAKTSAASAKVTDQTAIQFRTLNTRKGPAVQGTRTQNDKVRYRTCMKAVIERQENLEVKQSLVEELLVEGNRIVGVRDHLGVEFLSSAVVLTTGTFLNGVAHTGEKSGPAGRSSPSITSPLSISRASPAT